MMKESTDSARPAWMSSMAKCSTKKTTPSKTMANSGMKTEKESLKHCRNGMRINLKFMR